MKIINLSKFIGYTMTALILCLCMFWSPSFASASTSSALNNVITENEVNPSASYTKYVFADIDHYGPEATIPSTYYYNKNGFKGTLYVHYIMEFPTYLWVTYAGNVTCERDCPMPVSIEEY
ncbi:hypothetical protein [Solibacillus sp. CAU 1738]|uniref:hypothetical protein n=1 Tax=Solibacillus sp. CAU 1738 TaxID=3140363 RepID=UPI00326136FC